MEGSADGALGAVLLDLEDCLDGSDMVRRPLTEREDLGAAGEDVAVQERDRAVLGKHRLIATQVDARRGRRRPLGLGPVLLALDELVGVGVFGEHDPEAGGGDGGHF